jgi:hypothetical protein
MPRYCTETVGWNSGPCGPAPCTGECRADESGVTLPDCLYCGNEFDPADDWADESGDYCSVECARDACADRNDEMRADLARDDW